MSSFTSPLVVTPMPDGRRWRLVERFRYRIGSMESDRIITVPVGFVTDFASIPWLFWQFLPAWGRYGKAAVVHDYLYQHHMIQVSENLYFTFSRDQADDIFHEAMLVENTRHWKAKLMWLAVRLCGWLAWRRKQ